MSSYQVDLFNADCKMSSSNTPSILLGAVTRFYLDSGDFNGTPVHSIDLPLEDLRNVVAGLVREEKLAVNFGDRHPNAHVKAFPADPVEEQLAKLATAAFENACLYPTPPHLAEIVGADLFKDRPFARRLALGMAQLEYFAFDLRVLERYRNDPRYHYETDDIQGWISVRDRYYESEEMKESDQVLLEHFGFGYDRDVTTRAVVAFVRDLDRLSPEHQQLWELHRLDGEYLPHPDFWAAMMGSWDLKASIFQAFVEELRQINEMCKLIGRPPLFRDDFAESRRPKKFGFLLRPTLAEYNDFVLLLDKMISDNIERAFFQTDVEFEILEERNDGKFVARQKGTLKALEEWLMSKFRPKEPKPLEDMFENFRKVRKLRQKPAHAVNEDIFDQKYFREQRELIIDAYGAMRTLRLILANHPRTRGHEVPEWLYKGEIWTR
jgi:hypothetical protein